MSLCECGCGQPTVVSPCTDRSHGWVRGKPRRFLAGHNNVLRRTGHLEEDRGYETPCWIWQGSLNDRGYAYAWTGPAYRIAYERIHGPLGAGLEIDHLCRQRDCVNPDHLEPVTHRENMRRSYAVRQGRAPEGIPNMIRTARLAARLSQSDLAERLGCSQALVALWERGRHKPTAEWMAAVRRELAEVA